MNFEAELKAIAKDMTAVYRNMVRKKGLVKSGRLINSIKFRVVKTNTGFRFEMTAKDYFEHLNEEYSIQSDVLKSAEWKVIVARIAKAYALQMKQEIIKDLKSN